MRDTASEAAAESAAPCSAWPPACLVARGPEQRRSGVEAVASSCRGSGLFPVRRRRHAAGAVPATPGVAAARRAGLLQGRRRRGSGLLPRRRFLTAEAAGGVCSAEGVCSTVDSAGALPVSVGLAAQPLRAGVFWRKRRRGGSEDQVDRSRPPTTTPAEERRRGVPGPPGQAGAAPGAAAGRTEAAPPGSRCCRRTELFVHSHLHSLQESGPSVSTSTSSVQAPMPPTSPREPAAPVGAAACVRPPGAAAPAPSPITGGNARAGHPLPLRGRGGSGRGCEP
mmetsp:Transcript_39225/g.123671  ORF Transcript_39225/g.123671 Transcript_39225/m.123671 type:complete len:281 (+) Transcript_39225:381-1223(+)